LSGKSEKLIVEKANIDDVPYIHLLINHYAQKGQMLPKTLSYLYEHLRQYVVVRSEGQIVAVGGLRIFWSDIAEICSVAVAEGYYRRGLGAQIIRYLEKEALSLGLNRIFALTYQTAFFVSLGFVPIERSLLPQKIWQDCFNCPKYHNCDEQAVVKKLFKK
jgi:amino-acid N-acetyltransferase